MAWLGRSHNNAFQNILVNVLVNRFYYPKSKEIDSLVIVSVAIVHCLIDSDSYSDESFMFLSTLI